MRTIPSDHAQGAGMRGLLHHFGWIRIALIKGADSYSKNALLAVEEASRDFRVPDIKVYCDMDFSEGTVEFDTAVRDCIEDIKASGVKVVLVSGQAIDTAAILLMALDMGVAGLDVDTQWIVTESMISSYLLEEALLGRGLPLDTFRGLWGTGYGFNNLSITDNQQMLLFDFYRDAFPGSDSIQPLYAAFAFDAVLAVAHGVRNLLKDYPGDVTSFLSPLQFRSSLRTSLWP